MASRLARGSWSTRSAAYRAASAPTPRRPSQQAILDGVNVINFSISGGANPYTDPVELAFLDAYNAGVFVAASAGNSGPGAGTTDHRRPWVTTVAASTQSREFQSTLTVTGGDGASATFVGTSLTHGVAADARSCSPRTSPATTRSARRRFPPAGHRQDRRLPARRASAGSQKGFNVNAGGAVGMILYNLPLADAETDNHFLPDRPPRRRHRVPRLPGGAPERHRHASPTASRPTARAT